MGCDIHSVIQGQHIETEKPDSSCWHTVAEGFAERNYELFGFLAGVRGSLVTPLSQPRGWPNDFENHHYFHPIPLDFQFRDTSYPPISPRPWIYDMGDHSFTWFTGKEIADAIKDCPEGAFDEYMRVCKIQTRQRVRYHEYTNWRIIIGFDS